MEKPNFIKKQADGKILQSNFIHGLLKALLLFTIIMASASVYATDYYVSNAGNDSNSGTSESQAWKTLNKVNSFTPSPGDRILFRKGDSWSGTITINASGTSGSPIYIGSYGTGDKPKIYGSQPITGWTTHSGSIYKAKPGADVNQLFLDQARLKAARHPNSGYLFISSVQSSNKFTSSSLNGGINYTGATWFGRTAVYFTSTRTVTASSSSTLTLNEAPDGNLGANEGFFLVNKLEFLDQAGEWFYDKVTGTVYLWTPRGDNPSNYTIRGSVHKNGIYASNRNYITIQGLEILQQAEKSIVVNSCDYVVIDNNTISNPDQYGIYNDLDSKNNTITNNIISGANHYGVYARISYSKFSDNKVMDSGLFDNIGISGTGNYHLGGAVFIAGIQGNNQISYNRILNSGYNGIYFARPNNTIEYNFIDRVCLVKGDGGGIYTSYISEPGPHGSVVRSNIVLNATGSRYGYTASRAYGEGIYIDESAEDVIVEKNTIGFCSNTGVFLHDNSGTIVRHNTIFNGRYGVAVIREHGKNTIHDNIIYSFNQDEYEPNQLFIKRSAPSSVFYNNTYINHYNTAKLFRNNDSYYDANGWKSTLGQDATSKFDLSKLNAGEKEELHYNDTKQSKTINLGTSVYKDINGKQVTGSITLAPFTSMILIKTGTSNELPANQSPLVSNQSFNVNSSLSLNALVGQVVASDPDAGQTLTYSIEQGNADGLFHLDPSTGKIYAAQNISYTSNKTVNLTIKVADNASSPLSATATVTINISIQQDPAPFTDITAPVVSSFRVQSTSTSLTVNVESFTASDDVGVAGYMLSESPSKPTAGAAGWSTSAPSKYTFSIKGNKTLYAWAKDAAGNVSAAQTASVAINTESEEYITICEGEQYNGWTTSGTYTRTVTSDAVVSAGGTNLIANGNFSNGTTGWSNWSATGYSISLAASSSEYASSSSSMEVSCSANGTSTSSIQLFYNSNLQIEAGKTYEVVFQAKATTPFAIGRLYIHQGVTPWTNYGTFDISQPQITQSWKQYTIKFTASHSASDASFRIYLGNSLPAGHKVYFDDFSFAQLSEGTNTTTESTVITHLTVNPSVKNTEEITINEGENYQGWTTSGQYERTLVSAAGCDSIVVTNLTVVTSVQPVVENIEYVTICEGENYNGWTTSGQYQRTVSTEATAEAGANKISNGDFSNGTTGWNSWNASGYGLTLSASSTEYVSSSASMKATCTANGTSVSSIQVTYNPALAIEAGKTYEVKFQAKATTMFNIGRLYIHQNVSPWTNYGAFDVSQPEITQSWKQYTIKFTASHSAADASFRIYLGKTMPAGSTVYFDDFSIAEFQETTPVEETIITNLTVTPAVQTTEDVTINEGENYLGWTTSGQYQRTLKSAAGCDSTVTTILTVVANAPATVYSKETVAICEGENYMNWTVSGEYSRTLSASSGADSIVTTYLTVNPVYQINEDVQISEGESYNGWTSTGTYERTLTSSAGCDSIVTTNLTVSGVIDLSPTYSRYMLEEGTGTTVYDNQGKVDGTLVNEELRVVGYEGQGLQFTGKGYINLGDNYSANIKTQFTLSAWIKPNVTSGEYQGIIAHGGSNGETYGLYIHSGLKQIGFRTTGTTSEWFTADNISQLWDGNWHMLTVVYDGSEKIIYVDNSAVATISASGEIASGRGYNLVIGAGFNGSNLTNMYSGLIDDVKIYNYALKPVEIRKMTGGNGKPIVKVAEINRDVEDESVNQFNLYPNPARSYVNIDFQLNHELETRIEIIDATGRVYYSEPTSMSTNRIDINQFPSGVYYVRSINEKQQLVKKLIIE